MQEHIRMYTHTHTYTHEQQCAHAVHERQCVTIATDDKRDHRYEIFVHGNFIGNQPGIQQMMYMNLTIIQ